MTVSICFKNFQYHTISHDFSHDVACLIMSHLIEFHVCNFMRWRRWLSHRRGSSSLSRGGKGSCSCRNCQGVLQEQGEVGALAEASPEAGNGVGLQWPAGVCRRLQALRGARADKRWRDIWRDSAARRNRLQQLLIPHQQLQRRAKRSHRVPGCCWRLLRFYETCMILYMTYMILQRLDMP